MYSSNVGLWWHKGPMNCTIIRHIVRKMRVALWPLEADGQYDICEGHCEHYMKNAESLGSE